MPVKEKIKNSSQKISLIKKKRNDSIVMLPFFLNLYRVCIFRKTLQILLHSVKGMEKIYLPMVDSIYHLLFPKKQSFLIKIVSLS